VLRDLCKELGVPSKGSKTDLLQSLKEHLAIPNEFLKVFSKFWGGSGKKPMPVGISNHRIIVIIHYEHMYNIYLVL